MTKRVLIVDDEPVLIDLLKEIFARFQHGHAYEITPAYSVVEAYDLLVRERFDLILLDMVVPVLGDPWPWIQGLDLLKRIRHLGREGADLHDDRRLEYREGSARR